MQTGILHMSRVCLPGPYDLHGSNVVEGPWRGLSRWVKSPMEKRLVTRRYRSHRGVSVAPTFTDTCRSSS
jgi:hypothetical protein